MKPLAETGLPEPEHESASHARRMARHLRTRIGDGSISFSEFMQDTLYAPGLGYYVSGNRKFGEGGDFVTAPEISDLFGMVVASQCAAILDELAGGDILEPGGGSGALAVSMLRRLDALDALPRRYLILEVSPELQARQEERIRRAVPKFADRIQWISTLPDSFRGVVVANEVADAIPVERFRIADGVILQARVGSDGDRFHWCYETAPDSLVETIRTIEATCGRPFPDGYESEISPGVRNWVADVCSAVERGAVLIFDYGVSRREYYAPDRSDGWLQCHFRHRAHGDPLILTGIQDLTAWVDFSVVAEAGVDSGMSVAGYTTQAEFLLHGGITQVAPALDGLTPGQRAALSNEMKKLTLPGEMGENFKVIALCRGVPTPPAFQYCDKAHLL